jgi:hypothetical protein
MGPTIDITVMAHHTPLSCVTFIPTKSDLYVANSFDSVFKEPDLFLTFQITYVIPKISPSLRPCFSFCNVLHFTMTSC